MKKILFLFFIAFSVITTSAQDVFVNEFHYDNSGGDVNEFIEIAGPAGTDLTGWKIEKYNGNGGGEYGIISFSGTIDDEGNGFGAVSILTPSLQNGAPDGFALIDASDNVVQFLSYEGSFTASSGFANGMTSTDVGVSEPGSTPIGFSLQLTGSGAEYSDFAWNSPAADSPGNVNVGQTFVAPGPTVDSTFCSDETPLPMDPPALISTFATATSTANPGDTGIIGAGLGQYAIASVDMNIQSGWASDLTITLQAPSGATMELSSNNGGPFGLDPAADLIFVDGQPSVTTWTGGTPSASGYQAEGGTFAANFSGEDINGDWYILIDADATFNDGGSLNTYCVTFEMNVGDAPEIFCIADFAADNDEGVCGAVVNFAPPIAIDNEDGVLDPANVEQTGGLPTGSVFPVGDNVVTFTATDSHGNETSCSFTITVLDAEAPMAVCQDVTVTLDAMGMGSIADADLDGGSTDNCAVDSVVASQTSFDCSDVGTVTVTLEVFDAAGNSSTCEATVTVIDDIAPVIECIGGPSFDDIMVNGSFEDGDFTGWTAIDNSGPFIAYFVGASNNGAGFFDDALPTDGGSLAGNGFDGGAGEAILYQDIAIPSGSPAELSWDENIDYNLLDFCNGCSDRTYEVQVRDLSDNVLEVLKQVTAEAGVLENDNVWESSTADLSAYAGQTVRIAFWQNMPDTNSGPAKFALDNVQLNIAVSDATPLELDLNADGTVSVPAGDLILDVDEACGYTVTSGSSQPCEQSNPGNAFENGLFNNGAPFDVANDFIADGDFTLNQITLSLFHDVGATITEVVFTYYEDAGGLPGAALSSETVAPTSQAVMGNNFGFDVSDVVFDVTPTSFAAGTYWIGTRATSSSGGITAWEVSTASAVGANAANSGDAGATWADAGAGDGVYTFSGVCGSSDPLNFNFDCSNLGENFVEVFITDDAGNVSSCIATVVVSDVTAPVIVCGPGDGAVSMTEDFEGSSVPAGWSVDTTVGSWDWAFGSGAMPNSDPFPTNAGIFDDDAAGNGETNVSSLVSPMYDLTGGATSASISYDYSLDELGDGETLMVEAWDGAAWQEVALYDADVIPPTNSGVMDVLAYANADFQVRFTYDDNGSWGWGAGVDNFQLDYAIPPTTSEVIVELGEDGTTSLDPMDFLSEAYDACGIDVLIADLEEVTCDDIGAPIVVTVFATDASGNVSSCSVEVLVVDTMAPVLTCPADESVMVDPDGSHTLADYIGDGAATATDNCTDPVTDFTQSPAPGTILGVGTHIITFTATDEYGNVSTCEMTLDLTILGTQDNELNNAIALYPNPANEQVTISNSSNIALETAMIYDLNGKLVSQINLQDMQSEKVINVSGFATGVYMVYITGEQSSVVKRLIKE